MTTELTVSNQETRAVGGVFASIATFETAQRMATALASSELVPTSYKGKTANCLVALEVAQRTGSSVLMVMQNLNMINGRPSWSSSYIIAAINSARQFSMPLQFKIEGTGDKRSCVAWTKNHEGERLEGPPVSIEMAKLEGWYERTGSKWKTMPELMLRYRAAAFFGRLYAPDILMGMRSEEEQRDIIDVPNESEPAGSAAAINKKLRPKKTPEPAPVVEPETEAPNPPEYI